MRQQAEHHDALSAEEAMESDQGTDRSRCHEQRPQSVIRHGVSELERRHHTSQHRRAAGHDIELIHINHDSHNNHSSTGDHCSHRHHMSPQGSPKQHRPPGALSAASSRLASLIDFRKLSSFNPVPAHVNQLPAVQAAQLQQSFDSSHEVGTASFRPSIDAGTATAIMTSPTSSGAGAATATATNASASGSSNSSGYFVGPDVSYSIV